MRQASDSRHSFYFMPEIIGLMEMFGRELKWLSAVLKS